MIFIRFAVLSPLVLVIDFAKKVDLFDVVWMNIFCPRGGGGLGVSYLLQKPGEAKRIARLISFL